eukprot:scpid85894/ scgid8694/ Phosphatidylinositol-glycan biosynthesis class F protein
MRSVHFLSVLSLAFAGLAGLLPFRIFGLNIDTAAWLFPVQVLVAGLVQFAISFNSQAEKFLPALASAVGGWIVGAVIWHVVFVLFGAALIENATYTASISALASSLTAVPLSSLTGYKVYESLSLLSRDHYSVREWQMLCQCAGVATGVYASAVVIPLDWDRQWQVWPCPCIIGAWGGCCLGNIIACCTAHRVDGSALGRKTA